ncbi:MAG: hypothetical protein QXQ02_01710, partial [Halobacteria archaeon]
HIHHNPARSYGVVKIAHFDKQKKRIDLIVALNADKYGVEKNGGLIADKELERLFRQEPIPVSMSCLVSYDICSGCGHKARNIRERCTHVKCAKYGGCAENLGKTFRDGHTLHVLNPDPVFFDISYVIVPADRIAFSLGIVRDITTPIEKLSNDEAIERFYKSHTELKKQSDNTKAKNLVDRRIIDLIRKFSSLEQLMKPEITNDVLPFIKKVSYIPFDLQINNPQSFIANLYDNKQILHPQNFFEAVYPGLCGSHVAGNIDVSRCFTDLLKRASLEQDLLENPYFFCQSQVLHYKEMALLNQVKPFTSLAPEFIAKRATDACLHLSIKPMVKKANLEQNSTLAGEYALYLLGGILRGSYNWKQILPANQVWFVE